MSGTRGLTTFVPMDFTTINEYFYKLFSRLLLILILPIFSFIVLHLLPQTGLGNSEKVLQAVIPTVVVIWIIGLYLNFKKINAARNGQGLRDKLEKYWSLTIVRFSMIAFVSLVLAVGFAFSQDNSLTYAFLFHLLIAAIIWPHAPRVSKELRLRGDERQMVYFRKDRLD